MKKFVILLIAAVIILSSCSTSATLSFRSGLSGSAEYGSESTPFFLGVLEDFSAFSDADTGEAIFRGEAETFAANLNAAPSASSVTHTENGALISGSFSYSDFESLFSELSQGREQTIFSVSRSGNRTTLSIDINVGNYEELASLIPIMEDPTLSGYGPKYNQSMSADDYKEMIAFVMGDDGPDAIDSSSVAIVFNAPGRIVSTNGERISSTSVRFAFPLIDFLLLHEPLSFYVTWTE